MAPVSGRRVAVAGVAGVAVRLWGVPVRSPPRRLADASRLLRRWAAQEQAARRPFLWLPVAMGVGSALYFVADSEPAPAAPVVGLALSVLLASLARRRHRLLMALCLGLAALFAGFAAAAWRTQRVAAPTLERPLAGAIEGLVVESEKRVADQRLLIRVTHVAGLSPDATPQLVRVTVPSAVSVAAGDAVAGTARLMPPPQPSRPGGYDFARDAYFQGIGAVGSLGGAVARPDLRIPPSGAERFWILVDRLRNHLTDHIVAAVGGQAGAVAAALVTGKRGLVDEATNDVLRGAGIYHVISISGLHMVLAAGMVFWILRAGLAIVPGLALVAPIRTWAAVGGFLAALAYGLFAGAQVATARSMLMTMIMFGAMLANRRALTQRNLALAAVLLIIAEPESVLGPSFQMSFFAVAALVALHERGPSQSVAADAGFSPAGQDGTPPPSWPVRVARLALMPLATTLAAEFATAPFSLYHFQQFTPYGLVGNALTLPVVSIVVMPAALLGALALPFGFDGPVWWAMGQGVALMLEAARLVASWPGSILVTRALNPSALQLLVAGLAWLLIFGTPLRWLGLLPVLACIATGPFATPVDLVVARDGRSLMLRGTEGRLTLLGASPGPFVLGQWLHADGDARVASDPSLAARQSCDALGCTARLASALAVALVRDARAFEEDCRRAAIVVTPLRAPAACRPSLLLLDRMMLATTGATEVRLAADGPPQLRTTRAGSRRPWWPRSPEAPAGRTPSPSGSVPSRPVPDPAEATMDEIAAAVQ
jgi:competence protein ComEC